MAQIYWPSCIEVEGDLRFVVDVLSLRTRRAKLRCDNANLANRFGNAKKFEVEGRRRWRRRSFSVYRDSSLGLDVECVDAESKQNNSFLECVWVAFNVDDDESG